MKTIDTIRNEFKSIEKSMIEKRKELAKQIIEWEQGHKLFNSTRPDDFIDYLTNEKKELDKLKVQWRLLRNIIIKATK